MDDTKLQGLEAQLDTIIRLLAAPLVKDRPIAESAPILSQLGMDNIQIATICNTKPNVVRTALARDAAKKARDRRGY